MGLGAFIYLLSGCCQFFRSGTFLGSSLLARRRLLFALLFSCCFFLGGCFLFGLRLGGCFFLTAPFAFGCFGQQLQTQVEFQRCRRFLEFLGYLGVFVAICNVCTPTAIEYLYISSFKRLY